MTGVCFGSTDSLGGTAEAPFGSCKEGDTVATGVCSGGIGGLFGVAEATLRSCREEISVVVGMCSGGLCDIAEGSVWSFRGGLVVSGLYSGGAGDLRDTAEGSLRACSSERTFPLSTRGGWGDSERASLICVCGSYESMLLGRCIRFDAIFAKAGAGGDDDGDMEALRRSKGEGIRGLAGAWTEVVQSTCSACGLVAFVSLDEKGGGEGVACLIDSWTELEAVRLTSSARGLFAFLSLDEKDGG